MSGKLAAVVVALAGTAVLLSGAALLVTLSGSDTRGEPSTPAMEAGCVDNPLLAASRGVPTCPGSDSREQVEELERRIEEVERGQPPPEYPARYPTQQPYVPYDACDDPLITNSYACR